MGVRVAGGQGFYGDTPRSVTGLLDAGIDYLCLEALAELTLAILQKDRQRDEARGFTRDLPAYLTAALPSVAAGRVKVITNAGGINPAVAARAAIDTARELGLSGIRVATVLGDDLTGRLDAIGDATKLRHLESGAPFSAFPGPALFASAYLGARRSWRRCRRARTWSSRAGSPTRRCSSPRSSTSTAGRSTTGTGWPRGRWSGTCSSARGRAQAGT